MSSYHALETWEWQVIEVERQVDRYMASHVEVGGGGRVRF